MRLAHVQQLDPAALNVVNATAKLYPLSRIDLGLIRIGVFDVEASQAAMDHGSTIMLVTSEDRLRATCDG